MFILMLNLFPTLYRCMLYGTLKALGIQKKAVYIHLFCQWIVFMFLIWLFAFYLEWGLKGMWIAKISLEWIILIAYTILIKFADWEKLSQ